MHETREVWARRMPALVCVCNPCYSKCLSLGVVGALGCECPDLLALVRTSSKTRPQETGMQQPLLSSPRYRKRTAPWACGPHLLAAVRTCAHSKEQHQAREQLVHRGSHAVWPQGCFEGLHLGRARECVAPEEACTTRHARVVSGLPNAEDFAQMLHLRLIAKLI